MVQGEGQDILRTFSKHLNFQIRQFKRIEGGWGAFDKKKSQWNGMVSNLVNNDADMIVGSLDACCGRTEAIDYLWPLKDRRVGFAIKSNLHNHLTPAESLKITWVKSEVFWPAFL